MPTENWIQDISGIMERFVTQGFSIAKKRLYLAPSEGGLGLFDLKIFLQSMQSTWVKRTFLCCNDNWKFDLIHESEHCIEKVGIKNGNLGKTLLGIAKSFRTFAEVFVAQVDSNYLHAPIQYNTHFGYGHRGGLIFYDNFFIFAMGVTQTTGITWGMLTKNMELKNIDELRNILGNRLTQEKFYAIRVGWKRAKKSSRYRGKKVQSFTTLLNRTKRGLNASEISSQKIP